PRAQRHVDAGGEEGRLQVTSELVVCPSQITTERSVVAPSRIGVEGLSYVVVHQLIHATRVRREPAGRNRRSASADSGCSPDRCIRSARRLRSTEYSTRPSTASSTLLGRR